MNISFVNDSNDTQNWRTIFQKNLESVFKKVQYGETDVIFNIVSPTPTLGKIDILIFISIDDKDGNYYFTPDRIYLHTLAIGIKKLELNDVVDVNEHYFFNDEGSWNYSNEIVAENKIFDRFCYGISPEIKYFNSALFYYVNAPHCSKSLINDYVYFNSQMNLAKLFASACRRCQSKKYKGAWSMQFSQGYNMHLFINNFIEETEAKTKQGILTKKKMNAIIKDSKVVNRILNVTGSRLCIIKGNPGAGKTLALMRIAYRIVSKEFDSDGEKRSHNARILTYNNMLVYDIKNTLKSMGTFASTNLSVQTLHKFFFDMFKLTPALWEKYMRNSIERINDLLNTCNERIDAINAMLTESYYGLNKKENSPYSQIEKYEKKRKMGRGKDDVQHIIATSDRKEADMYFQFLMYGKRWEILSIPDDLNNMKDNYLSKKKENAIEAYLNNAFVSDYEAILKDMYFLLKDPVKFRDEHNLNSKRDFFEFLYTADNQKESVDKYIEKNINKPDESVRSKIRWHHTILVDEAQDCSLFEKALIFEIRGPENIVIAHGGKDQMIRQVNGTDWSQYFGKKLLTEEFTFRKRNWRQKGNIVSFLNAFAYHFNLESKGLSVPPETFGYGHVIIDIRQLGEGEIAFDKMAILRNQGKDYGCSDYENLMVLLPHKGYTQALGNGLGGNSRLQASVDVTDTITFSSRSERVLNNSGQAGYEGIKVCDCTVNSKGDLNPGQSDTRFLYYDSCRGLESWNVMCIKLDDFFYEKQESEEAKEYATEASGLFSEKKSFYQSYYALTWCFMALTRPMDTLYISLRNTYSDFSKELLEIAKSCGDAVEIVSSETKQ